MAEPLRHRQTKEAETDMPGLPPPRHIPTLPKADLSKNSLSMLLSATSEALARLRASDLTAAAPCGPSLFEHTGFCKQGGPVLDTSQARRVSGSWGNGSRPKAISEIARLRRSLPEPDPENRAAISIRSARPPIITVIGASPVGARLNRDELPTVIE